LPIALRPYQERGVEEVRQGFRDGHKSVLFQMPTGAGKTLSAGHILGSAAEKQNRGMFICNRIELVKQTCKAFDDLGMRYGLIVPGVRYRSAPLVHIASIDTLKGRIKAGEILPPKLAVWDECRGCGAAGWARVHAWMAEQGARQLGLDATPIRLDGKGLDQFFSHLVHGPAYSELMALGNLVPFECYAPSRPDMSGVKTIAGEFDSAGTEEVMDKPSITGDIVTNYLQHRRGLKALVFAVSRKHSEHLVMEFKAAGVRAVHLDGDTDAGVRTAALVAYRRGEIEVISNVGLFKAGLDVPGVRVIIMANPTQSLSDFLQICGRGSRPDPEDPTKEVCYLDDHAGNIFRHGLPDEDRTWTLEGRKKGQKKAADVDTVNVRQCPSCYGVHAPAPTCKWCGHVYEIDSREVERREGELKKITKEELAAQKAKASLEVKRARTFEDLQRIGAQRGYSENWAENVWAGKQRARERFTGVSDVIAEQQFAAHVGWRR
jgi:DNA repair protein RadD